MPKESNKAEILWEALRKGIHFPADLEGGLELAEGYRLQMEMLERSIASGESLAGWKLAFTSALSRKMFRSESLGMGYLLHSRRFSDGEEFPSDDLINPLVEAELCFIMGATLKGGGITREMIMPALHSVAPAFEILERRGDLAGDLPLGIADNIFQWGFVTGSPLEPLPEDFDPGKIRVEIIVNGEVKGEALGAEVMDDTLASIAWLANQLAEFGQPLAKGQSVMSGTFVPPIPLKKGDQIQARFSGLGGVSAVIT